jgi:hypothetical protein
MARGAVIEVEGARELRRTLARAGHDLDDLVAANSAVAALVSTRSKSSAPHRSGRLAGSIRGSKAKASAVVRAGGAAVVYAGVIHYGWPAHNIEPDKFLTDTARATEPQWRAIYLAGVNKALAKVRGA